jgi:hypothetical protein
LYTHGTVRYRTYLQYLSQVRVLFQTYFYYQDPAPAIKGYRMLLSRIRKAMFFSLNPMYRILRTKRQMIPPLLPPPHTHRRN